MSTAPLSTESSPTRSKIQGRFVWYDLMTSDPAAAIPFYGAVMGWETQKFEGPQEYEMWVNEGVPIGGVMLLPDDAKAMGAPPHWLPYMGVEDIRQSADQVQRLGGRILVPPTPIPEIGHFAVAQDPQGAVFALYQSLNPEQVQPWNPQVGQGSWHELMTTDLDRAFHFYSQLFGWREVSSFDMGPDGVYRMYGHGETMYGGMFRIMESMQGVPPNWLSYFRVAELDATVERVKENGGQVMMGPMEVPGGDRIAQCMDPQGAAFALHEKQSS